jgi:hypothetical protein
MTDRLFHEIEFTHVILLAHGVYRQAKVYRRFNGEEHQLFAKGGSGYVRLLSSNGTTAPSVIWVSHDVCEARIVVGKYGAPVVDAAEALSRPNVEVQERIKK